MIFDFAVTIPDGTLETDPVREKLQIAQGIIHRVEIEQYSGCRRYVGCRLYLHDVQTWPYNLGGEFKTDGYTIAFDEWIEISEPPYELDFEGYSDGSSYDHVVVVRVGVIESKLALYLINLFGALGKLLKAFGVK